MLQHLKEKKNARRESISVSNLRRKERQWIRNRVINYLESTPAKQQTPSKVVNFLESLDEMPQFTLTEAERLMLLNLVPSLPVEVHLVS